MTSIKLLKISVRLENVLLHNGISTIEELCTFTESRVMQLNGIGRRHLNQLNTALAEKNITLCGATFRYVRRAPAGSSFQL